MVSGALRHFLEMELGTGAADAYLDTDFPVIPPKFRALCLKLNLATLRIILTCGSSSTAAPCQALMAESSVALPPVSGGVAYAVLHSHALNSRHRTLAPCTRQDADHVVPLLRRYHEALPHDRGTWSASETLHLCLPFLQRGRYKGRQAGSVIPCVFISAASSTSSFRKQRL
jgi:hypothetical protein